MRREFVVVALALAAELTIAVLPSGCSTLAGSAMMTDYPRHDLTQSSDQHEPRAGDAQVVPPRTGLLTLPPPQHPSPVFEIPWRARITSSPAGAEVFLLEEGTAGRTLGKTPLEVAIWTDRVAGEPGQLAKRTLTCHLPVIRTKDEFYCGFVLRRDGDQVERYATWTEGLREGKPSGGIMDIGEGLVYDLKHGKHIVLKGSYVTEEKIPESYARGCPPPRVSEISVDFTSGRSGKTPPPGPSEKEKLVDKEPQVRQKPRANEEGDAGTVQALVEKLRSQNPSEKDAAAAALGSMGEKASSAVEPLVALMKENRAYHRYPGPRIVRPSVTAATALGKIKSKRAVSALLSMIEEPPRAPAGGSYVPGFDDVPCECVRALAEIGDMETIPALVAARRKSNWSPFCTEISRAMLKMREPAIRSLGQRLLAGEEEESEDIAFLLVDIYNLSPAGATVAAKPDGKAGLEDAAVGLMSSDDLRNCVLPLMKQALSRQGYVRRNALVLSAYCPPLRDPSLLPTFVNLLQDDDTPTRRYAALSCGVNNNDAAVLPLSAVLRNDPGSGVRGSAALALGRIDSPTVLEPLGVCLREDANPGVRSDAAAALGSKHKDPRAVQILAVALSKETDKTVRKDIIRALRKLTGADLGENAEDWLKWRDDNNRQPKREPAE